MITINGQNIFSSGRCNNIQIGNNNIIINDKQVTNYSEFNNKEINVVITGDVDNLDCSGKVEVHGNVKNIDCSGSVIVTGDVTGDIDCSGSVHCGNVNGDIDCSGSVFKK